LFQESLDLSASSLFKGESERLRVVAGESGHLGVVTGEFGRLGVVQESPGIPASPVMTGEFGCLGTIPGESGSLGVVFGFRYLAASLQIHENLDPSASSQVSLDTSASSKGEFGHLRVVPGESAHL
jgi:hypothetical protein